MAGSKAGVTPENTPKQLGSHPITKEHRKFALHFKNVPGAYTS